MRPFHAVRRMNAGADQAALDVRASAPGSPDVRAVKGIYVGGIIDFILFCKGNQTFHHFVIVGSAAILDAYGNLRFFTGKISADAPHIHCEQLVRASPPTVAAP